MYERIVISIRPPRLAAFLKDTTPEMREKIVVLSGVNGETLNRSQIPTRFPLHNSLTRGELGCYMSHLCVWRQVIDLGRPALIMEDDAIMDESTMQKVQAFYEYVTNLDPEWDIILLGRNERFLRNYKSFANNISIPARSWGLFAYFVSPTGAARLKAKALPVRQAVDTFVSTLRPIKHVWAATENMVTLRKVNSDTFNIK